MAQVMLKGNPSHTNGELPKIDSTAPDFKLVDTGLVERSLKDYEGKRKLLSIVPSLDTPTCSLSAKKFNEDAGKLENTVVIVISADLPFAQKRVSESCGLENVVTLSAFRDKSFGSTYGILLVNGPLNGLLSRSIVVLDENNKVLYTELVPEITEEPNYEKALAALSTP